MVDPCILMCAPNGARRSKMDHRALPIEVEEIAACASDVLEEGASILHLHVRDNSGGHTLDVKRYAEAQAAIRDRIGDNMIIQITSEAVGQYEASEQMDVVRTLRPEAVSLALRELLPGEAPTNEQCEFFKWMRGEGVFYQIILYDSDDLSKFIQFRDTGLFGAVAPFVLFVAGRYGKEINAPAQSIGYFSPHVSNLSFPWAVCGFGKNEYDVAAFAVRSGGHVRVGFENNLWCSDGSLAMSNADLVRQARKLVEQSERSVATVEQVREMFRLGGPDR